MSVAAVEPRPDEIDKNYSVRSSVVDNCMLVVDESPRARDTGP
jgi:hypothetical protein